MMTSNNNDNNTTAANDETPPPPTTTTAWREYNIHSSQAGDDDDEPDEQISFDLFAPSEPALETFDYPLPGQTTTLSLQGHGEYRQSTGLTVWKGSEVLADYLLQSANGGSPLCADKRVVELGAGLGLCGLVALLGCGALHVCLTDGDTAVLEQLRQNVAGNVSTAKATVCQLIWGHTGQIQAFKTAHGMADVILATDCLYMAQSVEPFFQTVDALLEPTSGMLVYCNPCASQAPVELIQSTARKYGLALVEEDYNDVSSSANALHKEENGGSSGGRQRQLDGDGIYCFRKRPAS